MCLDTITKRYEKPSARTVAAWKVFRLAADRDVTLLYQSVVVPLRRGEWLVAERRWIKPSFWYMTYADQSAVTTYYTWPSARANSHDAYIPRYISGFHACRTKAGAEMFEAAWSCQYGHGVVVRVLLRGVELEGSQTGVGMFVAREMYVPKPRKARKAGA